MVTKCEIIYFIISISDKRQSSFFMSLILTFSFTVLIISSFFPYLVHFNLLYLSGTCTFFFANIWTELSLLFLTDISEQNFFPGGGVHVHPVHPLAYMPALHSAPKPSVIHTYCSDQQRKFLLTLQEKPWRNILIYALSITG